MTTPAYRGAMPEAYDRLLAAIGGRASEIGERPVVTHGPHIGRSYRGLVVVGQAVYGWPDDWRAAELGSQERRAEVIRATLARNADRPEPLDWIESSPNRTSPFWTCARTLADLLEPGGSPWYSRIAWVNLYPAAPEDPPGNPGGALREAQDPHVAGLLRATLDAIGARTVVALVGPFWWPAGSDAAFGGLAERPRPLLRSGVADGRPLVVGWHPTGASRRGTGPYAYARLIADEVARVSA